MAYSEEFARRVSGVIGGHPALTERKMFGGVCYMLNGNMAVGVTGDDLMVRVAADAWDECLAMPHVRMMDFTGRPMRGWLFVGPAGSLGDAELEEWIERGMAFALALPPKGESRPRARRVGAPRSRSRSER